MEKLRRKLDILLAEKSHLLRCQEEESSRKEKIRSRLTHLLEAQKIVQEVAEKIQASAHQQIAGVVTRCLKTVFGEDAYTFHIDFEKKRGKTEARLLFLRDGKEIEPMDAAGGGIIDVCSFSLRLACLLLSRPLKRKFLCLDEPFKHLSKEYRPRVRELLLELCRELDLQILMVTHSMELAAGKVVELG